MKLTKIDLTNLVAIGHSEGYLGLLIDRGDEMEYIEIPAPIAAYQGLKQVNAFAASDTVSLPGSSEIASLPESADDADTIFTTAVTVDYSVSYESEEEVQ